MTDRTRGDSWPRTSVGDPTRVTLRRAAYAHLRTLLCLSISHHHRWQRVKALASMIAQSKPAAVITSLLGHLVQDDPELVARLRLSIIPNIGMLMHISHRWTAKSLNPLASFPNQTASFACSAKSVSWRAGSPSPSREGTWRRGRTCFLRGGRDTPWCCRTASKRSNSPQNTDSLDALARRAGPASQQAELGEDRPRRPSPLPTHLRCE